MKQSQNKITAASLGPPRWRGQGKRLEVWYATITDPKTSEGFWFHYETLARPNGQAKAHGWACAFPPDGEIVAERFGPHEAIQPTGETWFEAGENQVTPTRLIGSTINMSWDLAYTDPSPPLCTFPFWAWQKECLPGAQVLPSPTATFSGRITLPDRTVELKNAPGGLARIYGHGNAQQWAWLHAHLGGQDVLEVVAAQPRMRALRWLGTLAFVQLRTNNQDWPKNPLLAMTQFRTHLGINQWSLQGRANGQSITIEVELPPDDSVCIEYQDPDGSPLVCTNTERAHAKITVESPTQGKRQWDLSATAHSEIGTRNFLPKQIMLPL